MKNLSGLFFVGVLTVAATLTGCPPQIENLHTQVYPPGDAATALSGTQQYYMKDGSISFYSRTVYENIDSLPVEPSDHTPIDFSVADPFELNLPAGSEVSYYGVDYSTLYIGSDGTVAFGTAGTGNSSLADHFGAVQISLLPVDATTAGSVVTYEVALDAIIITFSDVDGNLFQSEFFVGGALEDDVVIAYPLVDASVTGLVGLSNGPLIGATQAEIDEFLSDYTTPCDPGPCPNTGSLTL